ncbi:MAG: DUF2948 family protein [Holosporaceae bacterium]|jgi:hypothetical protein|nr:DUF2948 family protein [Holosporaceae bacterium]
MNHEKLLIKAVNFEECDIISSLVQDSILHISFHSFHEDQKCLRLMLNRFCWEFTNSFDEKKCYYRVHSGLYIHNVNSIMVNNNIREHSYLNMLTLHSSKNEINLVFSGNKHMRVNIGNILVYLKDLHEKHPTLSLPVHGG